MVKCYECKEFRPNAMSGLCKRKNYAKVEIDETCKRGKKAKYYYYDENPEIQEELNRLQAWEQATRAWEKEKILFRFLRYVQIIKR